MSAEIDKILREQTAIEREQWDRTASGIILLGLEEPEMPRCLIAERFGESTDAVSRLLSNAGIIREPEGFADNHNKKRRIA